MKNFTSDPAVKKVTRLLLDKVTTKEDRNLQEIDSDELKYMFWQNQKALDVLYDTYQAIFNSRHSIDPQTCEIEEDSIREYIGRDFHTLADKFNDNNSSSIDHMGDVSVIVDILEIKPSGYGIEGFVKFKVNVELIYTNGFTLQYQYPINKLDEYPILMNCYKYIQQQNIDIKSMDKESITATVNNYADEYVRANDLDNTIIRAFSADVADNVNSRIYNCVLMIYDPSINSYAVGSAMYPMTLVYRS